MPLRKRMFKSFYPSRYADSVNVIDYRALYAQGLRGIVFDIDNTLEGYGADKPSRETAALLRSLADMGFGLCFASNNKRERVERFAENLGIPYLYKAGKPAKKAVFRAAELMGVGVSQIAVIGDQVFTDIWGGNRCGAYTVLVRPVTLIDPLGVRLKRVPERWFVKKYLKKEKKVVK